MAKAKDLAKIAALGALGYMLSKGKGDSSKTDTGDETERLAKRGESRRQITDYMKKAPEAKDANYGNEGRRTSMGAAPAAKSDSESKTPTTRKDPREAEAGMSRGTRTTSKDSREAEAGMSRGTRTTSMAGAGRGTVNPPSVSATDSRSAESGMSRGTRTTSMAGAGRGLVNPPVPKPADSRSAEAGMSRGTRNVSPGPGQADIDKIRRIQETFRVPSSMAGRPGYDEAGNPMKKGGMVKKTVKKMASGGMTASSRADGIATKGKTKCKMY